MQYRWKFKVPQEMELSRGFSHFFQIKAKNKSEDNSNGNDNQPILTITGTEKKGGNQLEIRHSAGNQPDGNKAFDTLLVKEDWSLIAGEWIDIFVEITYAEEGEIKIYMTRLTDKKVVVNFHKNNIDMWRGNAATDFARPKWGIYRSLQQKSNLRAAEEQVYFADISIKKENKTAHIIYFFIIVINTQATSRCSFRTFKRIMLKEPLFINGYSLNNR